MKIKITQPGWAGFTGDLGAYAFVDGISVDDIGRGDAAFLAGIVSIEDVADGKNPSMSQRIIDSYANEAPVEVVVQKPEPVSLVGISKESLEAIADVDGIKGLRKIADPLGVKANSITELIEKILETQAAAAQAAAAQAAAAQAAAQEG